MHYSSFLICVLASCLIPVFAAPTTASGPKPTAYNHGDIVGVRPTAVEEPDPSVVDYRKINIHPAVVVAGPKADGTYKVVTISNKHLHDPPQTDIKNFHHDVEGNVKLVEATKGVLPKDMKPWVSGNTGTTTVPMSESNLQKLKEQMVPHVDWKPPHLRGKQESVASSSKLPAQSSGKSAGMKAIPGQAHAGGSTHPSTSGSNKHLPGSRPKPHIPVGKKGQHVNAHAGGSKRPVVQRPVSRPFGKKAPLPNASSRHPGASGSKVRPASKPKVAKVHNKVKQPLPNRGAIRGRKTLGVKRSLHSW